MSIYEQIPTAEVKQATWAEFVQAHQNLPTKTQDQHGRTVVKAPNIQIPKEWSIA